MRHWVLGIAVASAGANALADVNLLTQQRSITAATSADGNSQTVTSPDFSPFVQNLSLSTVFQGPTGPITNLAATRIDCQVDPNRVSALGTLSVAGGTSAGGATELGDAKAAVLVTFQVLVATPFNLLASPRPDLAPTDEFVLEFKNLSTNTRLVNLDNTMTPQAVDLSGTLQPGQYSIKYRIECTGETAELDRDYSMVLSVPAPGALGVVGLGMLAGLRRRR